MEHSCSIECTAIPADFHVIRSVIIPFDWLGNRCKAFPVGVGIFFIIVNFNVQIINGLPCFQHFIDVKEIPSTQCADVPRRQRGIVANGNFNLRTGICFLHHSCININFLNIALHRCFRWWEVFHRLIPHCLAIILVQSCTRSNKSSIIVYRNFIVDVILGLVVVEILFIWPTD